MRFAPAPGRGAPVAGGSCSSAWAGRRRAGAPGPHLVLFGDTLGGEVCRAIAGAGLKVRRTWRWWWGTRTAGSRSPWTSP